MKIDVLSWKYKRTRRFEKISWTGYHYDAKELSLSTTTVVTITSDEFYEQSKTTAKASENVNKNSPGTTNNLASTKKLFNKLLQTIQANYAKDSINEEKGDKVGKVKSSLKKTQLTIKSDNDVSAFVEKNY